MNAKYIAPEIKFTEGNYRTVYDAIADIQDVIPVTEVTGDYIELEAHPNATGLEKELRGRALYNHITTATRETAMARFKALKAGENFHDLDPELKTTYSNADRTQNTIYMRLKYNEPSGTVVNVRKSMWIHPELFPFVKQPDCRRSRIPSFLKEQKILNTSRLVMQYLRIWQRLSQIVLLVS